MYFDRLQKSRIYGLRLSPGSNSNHDDERFPNAIAHEQAEFLPHQQYQSTRLDKLTK